MGTITRVASGLVEEPSTQTDGGYVDTRTYGGRRLVSGATYNKDALSFGRLHN